jgi:hypothetical protein
MPSFEFANVTFTPDTVPPLLSVTTPLTEEDCWAFTCTTSEAATTLQIAKTLRNPFMDPPKRSLVSSAFAKFQILVQQLVNHILAMRFQVTSKYVSEIAALVFRSALPTNQIYKFRFGFAYFLLIFGFSLRELLA